METTEPRDRRFGPPGSTRLLFGLIALILLVVAFGAIQAWSNAQTATRAEVAQTLGTVEPACRRIIGMTMRTHYMQTGRPMTRGELGQTVARMTTCRAINDQLDGITDAVGQQ